MENQRSSPRALLRDTCPQTLRDDRGTLAVRVDRTISKKMWEASQWERVKQMKRKEKSGREYTLTCLCEPKQRSRLEGAKGRRLRGALLNVRR